MYGGIFIQLWVLGALLPFLSPPPAMAAFTREHAYVAQAFDPSNIPDYKLAENQLPTKSNQELYAAATT